MGNPFPSTLPPQEMWHCSLPWEQVESSQGMVKGTPCQIACFRLQRWVICICTEMHLRIPSVILICPQRSYLVELSYLTRIPHAGWLIPTMNFFPVTREPWFPPHADCPVALQFCFSVVCVLGYFPCHSTRSWVYRVRGSVLGFQFWVSWFLAQDSSSVNTRLYIRLEASPGEAGQLAGCSGSSWVDFLGDFTLVWGQVPDSVCSETRFSQYIKNVLGDGLTFTGFRGWGRSWHSSFLVCKRNSTLHCGWVTARRRGLLAETLWPC